MAKKPLKKRVVKKKQDKVGLRITILLIWFLAGLYVGIAGWEKIYNNELKRQAAEAELMFDCSDLTRGFIYEGRSYCTIEDVNVEEHINFIANLRLGWMFYLPNPLPLLLTAFAFGAVGSVVKIIRTMIRLQEFSSFYALSLSPALGGMTALMLLGLSSLVPDVFSNAKIIVNPTVVPFLSLFAGAFSEYIQKWFQTILDRIFGMQKEKTDVT